ncbi:MAG: glycoside hydrolase family 2 TIM barrel-domain containing protein [Candidatus Limivicinus sp.]|jgi:beta-galactosidase
MTFHYENLSDPLIYKEGCVHPHSDHRFYRSERETEGQSSFRYDLNGLWRFSYAKNYNSAVRGFEKPEYDCRSWAQIRVPAHIQLEGYDRPQYVNVQYPWEGHEELIPGQIPTEFNPVASYVRYFTLPESMKGQRCFLVLEGAESAAAVWLNGNYIGYHEDSFTPAEFELSRWIQEGENKLAVQVFKWCLGSWCEDQDFFRFSGLYRDVYIYSIPKTHVRDLDIRAIPREDLETADLDIKAELIGSGTVTAELRDGEKILWREEKSGGGTMEFHAEIDRPRLWSAESPYLYQCRLEVSDEKGNFCELIRENTGFRRFEMKDGLMCLNGKRIVFNGVNRHEFSSRTGRCLSREDIVRDLKIIKQNNINAVRTCHYPNNSWMYRLCDEFGIYLIDETNMESHGTWDSTDGEGDRTNLVPGDRIEWQGMMQERVLAIYERDKNHPSVLIWSCGNESSGGSVIYDMSRFFKERDDTRLVHYEGIFQDRRYPDTSDMESQMYTPAAEIEKFLKENPEKPFICCEYCHAMGNSCGGLFKYTELAKREPRYQGGFIWDFVDQSLRAENRFGREYLAYGGDFGDRPTDYSFCGNGLVNSERVITPKMQEVKFLYQNLDITVNRGNVKIFNRNLFVSTSRWECRVRTERNGVLTEEKILETDVKPLSAEVYPLNLQEQTEPGLYTVTVSFHLREDELWAGAGHELAFGQMSYEIPAAAEEETGRFRVIHSKHNIGVRGENFEAVFSLMSRELVSYRFEGRELLDAGPMPNFWRAPTDNDRGNQLAARCGQWKLASLYISPVRATEEGTERLPYTLEEKEDSARITFNYWLPTKPEAFCSVSYQVFGSGRISVTLHYNPAEGLGHMPEFGMLFPLRAELSKIRWYGLGPMDSYWDRQKGGRLGLFESDTEKSMAPYLVPQECGNREQVRFAEVTDEKGRGLRFEAEEPKACCFSALPYSPHQLELAGHAYELPDSVHTFVRISMEQMGVGGDDSWGARTHEEFLLPDDRPLTFKFSFRGI